MKNKEFFKIRQIKNKKQNKAQNKSRQKTLDHLNCDVNLLFNTLEYSFNKARKQSVLEAGFQ